MPGRRRPESGPRDPGDAPGVLGGAVPPRSRDLAHGSADECDEALVARAKGDRAAFALLYARYLPPVLRYCQSRLRDQAEAEDAASQIFAKAMVALPSCRDDAFRAWLFAIARNTVVDAVRRRRPADVLDVAEGVADDDPGPEAVAVERDERRSVRALLVHLSPDQRRVVELRLAGLTGAEIAAALGMTIAAVKTHQFRAVRRLRAHLGVDDVAGANDVAANDQRGPAPPDRVAGSPPNEPRATGPPKRPGPGAAPQSHRGVRR
jgi:RNA polymerase sigma-70 factor (ECF subfamily)